METIIHETSSGLNWELPITYLWYNNFDEHDLKRLWSDKDLVRWITNYNYANYNWSWYLIVVDNDWVWHNFHCWHCSCFWPLENGYSWKFTKEEIIMIIQNFDRYEASESEKNEFLNFVNTTN